MESVDYSIISTFSQIDQDLEKEWDDLAARTEASIFMTFRWIKVWWEFYGDSLKLRIFLFRESGRLQAVFPIYIQHIPVGITRIRVAHLVGSDVPPRVFDPPLETGLGNEITSLLIRALVVDEACDLVSLGPVSGPWAERTGILNVGTSPSTLANLEIKQNTVFTYHTLPDSFEEYYSSLSHKERRIRRQKMNIFTKEFNPHIEVLTDPEDIDSEIISFMTMHNNQWVQERMLGYFGGWPKATDFNRKVACELASLGRTWLMKISVDNRPVLYQYAFALGKNCNWVSSARVGGKEWERYSLGATNALCFLRHCVESGLKRVESGLGSFEYKTKLGGIEAPTLILRYSSRTFTGRMRYGLYRTLSGLVDLIYHKLYYNRIQSHLPMKLRRPNWMGWIRLRY
jgi:hypothetical protein